MEKVRTFHYKEEDITELFEVLQEWNDYLEHHIPHFVQSQSVKHTKIITSI